MKTPKFEVLSLTPLSDAGALRAFATVKIAGKITIHKIRLIQQDGQAAWCSGPQEAWTDAGGKKRFTTLIELSERDWRDALTEAVVTAYQDHPGGIREISPTQISPTQISPTQISPATSFGSEVIRRAGLGDGQ